MRHIPLAPLLLVAGFAVGCSCDPGVPPNNPDPPPETTTDTAEDLEETGDTAPPPRCAYLEEEPNDTVLDANFVEMEARGCGQFDDPVDPDHWTFDFPSDGWLGVRIDSASLGSAANVRAILTSDELGLSVDRLDNEGSTDVDLLFPADAGTYTLLVSEENNQGGVEGRYGYEVLATSSKIPVSFTVDDPGDNTNAGAAFPVAHDDAVLGALEDPFNPDWYRIDVPPGRHVLVVEVQAFGLGSPADPSMWLYDDRLEPLPEGCGDCEIRGGPGDARDPYFEYSSNGNETIYVSLKDVTGRSGTPYWYLISFFLESA